MRFSPEFARRSGMKTSPAVMGEIVPTITVTGTVRFDPKLVAAIGARINGRVRKIFKVPGDRVKAGDALAELESAELGRTQSAALTARAHAQAASANEKRERGLADARVSSERDAELAHAQAEAARAELHAAEQAVRALGGQGIGAELGVLLLRSPIDGKVVESSIYRGQSLEPSHTAFRVADLSRVWVELAVFERELSAIRPGDVVDLAPQTDRKAVEHGKVAYVGDVIDLDTRSAAVRIEVDNAQGLLRPGQSVMARVHTTAPASNVLHVPMSAVTRIDGVPTVFVLLTETRVEPRKIELGLSDGTRVQVVSGLALGELVVTEGVFAMKSELFR
ncbi:MAG: efflux RND transporter periplasmic adaptor subunit [Deltaproteobacteria bacterium]|nr:efflux RND transporter periplasmic adaptor subunit [Deltaproteobacteria bacterium]